ncbi:MAG: tRNA (adenosine(37)-N6)-dimethylallyltransferase MiaA [Puniceicoccales bacterium]|jgi:tRNA dimethylallyltransferase|nr:tRNA (adenosine(37)-N6)-dimethylallyltransferase MiaA [Puniceicoccales bacterium]
MVLPLFVIAGPTAVGKSALGISLAKRFGGVVLSCDSVQVYRAMDIGTAKVSAEERAMVTHFGLDLCEPDRPYDVKQFADHAAEVLLHSVGPVFCVGGSGFYLKMFYGPVYDSIAVSPAVRERVRAIEKRDGLNGLLQELDSHGGGNLPIDRKNPRRVARFLERTMESDVRPAILLEKFRKMKGSFAERKPYTLLLEGAGPDYEGTLRRRIEKQLTDGLVGETEMLRQKGFEQNPSACGSVGYREALDLLDGRIGREELPERILIRTRQLARKQRTWLRHQIAADVVLPPNGENFGMAADFVERRLF